MLQFGFAEALAKFQLFLGEKRNEIATTTFYYRVICQSLLSPYLSFSNFVYD